jgi:hypothetical protein
MKLSHIYPLGFWKWKNHNGANVNVTNNVTMIPTYRPLYTRKQLVGCWDEGERDKKLGLIKQHMNKNITISLRAPNECEAVASLARFEDYEFAWNDDTVSDVLFDTASGTITGEIQQFQQQGKVEKLCFMGMSHSRNMVQAVGKLHLDAGQIKVVHQHWMLIVFIASENWNAVQIKRKASKPAVINWFGRIEGYQEPPRLLSCSCGNWTMGCVRMGSVASVFYQYEERMRELVGMVRIAGI